MRERVAASLESLSGIRAHMFSLGRVQPKEAPAGCECRIHRDLGIERPFCLLSTRSHIYTPRERRMGSLASIYFLWSSPCLLRLWMLLLPSFPLAFMASYLDSLPKSMAPCSAQMDKDAEWHTLGRCSCFSGAAEVSASSCCYQSWL